MVTVSSGLNPGKIDPTLLKGVSFVSPTALLPASADLRPSYPPPYDQGQLGSCTANAACGCVEVLTPAFLGSRLYLYYQTRVLEGNVNTDSGAQLHSVVSALEKMGMPAETDWPYNITQFTALPPAPIDNLAKSHLALQAYNMAMDPQQMKASLSLGIPWMVGFPLYTNLYSNNTVWGNLQNGQWVKSTGIIAMPGAADTITGYHATCMVGYDDANQWWIVRNSWGPNAGDGGYFYMPYAYLRPASDIWVISSMMGMTPKTDCTTGLWSAASACSATVCGTAGTQLMTRAISQAAVNGGALCPSLSQTQACVGPCQTTPVDCVVGPWVAAGACSATVCGAPGTQPMTRVITKDAANGGAPCPTLSQTQACTGPCPLQPIDCTVGPWSTDPPCVPTGTAKCGSVGTATAVRSMITPASNGGAICPTLSKVTPCTTPACTATDCAVSGWSAYGVCDATMCGTTGQQTATRTIATPAAGGGLACPALSMSQPCKPSCTTVYIVGSVALFVLVMLFILAILLH